MRHELPPETRQSGRSEAVGDVPEQQILQGHWPGPGPGRGRAGAGPRPGAGSGPGWGRVGAGPGVLSFITNPSIIHHQSINQSSPIHQSPIRQSIITNPSITNPINQSINHQSINHMFVAFCVVLAFRITLECVVSCVSSCLVFFRKSKCRIYKCVYITKWFVCSGSTHLFVFVVNMYFRTHSTYIIIES